MGKRTTVQSNDPWKPAQPYILDSLAAVGDTFRQNQPALQSAATDFYDAFNRSAPGAETGINLAQNRVNATLAGQNAGLNPGQGAFLNAMNNPRATNDYMGQIAPQLGQLGQFGQGGFVGQGAGADYFRDVVGGRFVNNNPFLQANIDAAIGDARNAVNSTFSLAGRYGSEAHQGTLAREAGRISNAARAADLSAERDRQQTAAGSLDALTRSDRGLQLGAIGQGAGLGMQALGADEQARAASQQTQLAAAEAADRGFNLDQARIDQAVGMGQDLRAGNLGLLGNAAQLPWLGVQAQAGGVTGLSSPYGTQTTTQRGSVMDTISGGLGLGLQAASLFSEPGMKKNIKPLGARPDGLGVYEFEYKPETGLPGGRQVGVMADEVQALRPDALGPTIGGARTVNYDALQQSDMTGAQMANAMPAPAAAPRKSFGDRLREGVGRVTDPNNPMAVLGASLMANSFGFEGLGRGLLGAQMNRQEQSQFQQRNEIDRIQAEGLANWRATQGARAQQPRIMQRRDGSIVAVDPVTLEETLVTEALPSNEPLVTVAEGGQPVYRPRSQAVGKPAFVKPAAAGGGRGGGLTANQAAKLKADAAAAIARGADPAKVQARLREMGVQ